MSSLVSIIVPCYKQDKFLPEALDSVLGQTYPYWECIIVNDGSPDKSEEIAMAYCVRDSRFKYIKKLNGGLSSARNAGLKVAKGEWIQFLDSDDYIAPGKLERSMELLEEDPQLSLVVTDYKMFVDDVLNPSPPFRIIKQEYLNFESVVYGWDNYVNIPIHSGLFRISLFTDNLFLETIKVKEDLVMWLHIFINNIKAIYLDETLAYYRVNPKSMTKNKLYLYREQVNAFNYIINFLPEKYAKTFAINLIGAQAYEIELYERDTQILKSKMLYRVESALKLSLRRLLQIKPVSK